MRYFGPKLLDGGVAFLAAPRIADVFVRAVVAAEAFATVRVFGDSLTGCCQSYVFHPALARAAAAAAPPPLYCTAFFIIVPQYCSCGDIVVSLFFTLEESGRCEIIRPGSKFETETLPSGVEE